MTGIDVRSVLGEVLVVGASESSSFNFLTYDKLTDDGEE